jgi:hypothetical protein
LFVCFDVQITSQAIAGQQVDWEGILTPTPQEFIATISSWMFPARTPNNLITSLPNVNKVIPTYRAMISVLNVDLEQTSLTS